MSYRYNGNTIGNHRHMFIKTPSMISSVDQAIPIWDLIGISQQEYEIRFNMPITTPIEKKEVVEAIEEVIEEVIEKVIEETKEIEVEKVEEVVIEDSKPDEVVIEEVKEIQETVDEIFKEIKDGDEVDLSNIVSTETVEMPKEFLKPDLAQMEFEAKPSLIRKTRSLRFEQLELI